MNLLAPQRDSVASMQLLERTLSLPETTERLVNHIWPLLMQAGIRPRQRCEEEAKDLAQNCLKKALSKKEDYDAERGEPGGWLYGFIQYEIMEYLRKQCRLPLQSPDNSALVGAVENHKEHRSTVPGSLEFISSVLPRFNLEDQIVLQQHVFEQKTHDEIAIALKLPVGTLRTRLCRLKGKLRVLLQESEKENAS